MILYILVFFSTLAADYAWTKYMMYAAEKRAHLAAFWSTLIIAFGAINVISYTTNKWLIIPALAGAYIGTFLPIWRANRIIAQK